MTEAAKTGSRATIARISEKLQVDVEAMRFLRVNGLWPGTRLDLGVDGGNVVLTVGEETIVVPDETADLVYVTASQAGDDAGSETAG